MPKLWDEIYGKLENKKAFSEVMVVDASEVAVFTEDMFLEKMEQSVDMLQHFPNVAPPFDSMFIEFAFKSKASKLEKYSQRKFDQDYLYRWGVWMVSYKKEEILGDTPLNSRPGSKMIQILRDILKDEIIRKETKWLVCLLPYTSGRMLGGKNPNLDSPLGLTVYPVKENGSLITRSDGVAISKVVGFMKVMDKSLKNAEPMFNSLGWPALMTLCFMHCKNVVVEKKTPPKLMQQIAKYNKKPQTFHVLRIQPMRQIIKSALGSRETDITRALHIVRGHFRTYDQLPLFGKYKGTFFVPQHIAGTADRVMEKEYALKIK